MKQSLTTGCFFFKLRKLCTENYELIKKHSRLKGILTNEEVDTHLKILIFNKKSSIMIAQRVYTTAVRNRNVNYS